MKTFDHLLDTLNAAAPAERPAIEALIRKTFQVTRTALVLDMTDFSISVRRTGILPHLALIRRMQVLARTPIVDAGGEIDLVLPAQGVARLLGVFLNPGETGRRRIGGSAGCSRLRFAARSV